MRTFQQFNVQDIVDYMAENHPNEEYSKDRLYVQLFLLTILGHLRSYAEKYEKLLFVENVSYIPERFIRYVSTLIEGNGKQYMSLGNMFNQEDPTVDEGLLYVMKQMAQPTTRAEFSPEMALFRVDTVAKNAQGEPTIERVRVNKKIK